MFWKKKVELPKYYSNLEGSELCSFLSEQMFQRISKFPIISIYPPYMEEDRDTMDIAIGLSRLLMRNLMLVKNISVQGPEDTPIFPYDFLICTPNIMKRSNHSVTGRICFDNRFSGSYEIYGPNGKLAVYVEETSFHEFIHSCSKKLAIALGGSVDQSLEDRWKTGQPKNVSILQEHGRLIKICKEGEYDKTKMDKAILKLLKKDSEYVLPTHLFTDDFKDFRKYMVEGLKVDPYDAQMHFNLFINVWDSSGYQEDAMRIIRKGIGLSPGHGKLHMCAPHASIEREKMLNHSELGYKLLPGNSFAVNNYMIYLQECYQGKEILERMERLAQEAIANDPQDPGSYNLAIEMFIESDNFKKAFEYAHKLEPLLRPPINKRTEYCIKQNPYRAEEYEAGRYNPYKELMELLKFIKSQM